MKKRAAHPRACGISRTRPTRTSMNAMIKQIEGGLFPINSAMISREALIKMNFVCIYNKVLSILDTYFFSHAFDCARGARPMIVLIS